MLHQVLLLENECVSHLIVIFFFSKNSPHQKSATQVFQIETFILNLQNIRVIEAHSGKTEDYFILFTGLLNTAKYILHRNSIQWNIEDHP